MKTRVENWCGYDIRFVELDGEWYAILKDICDALNLRSSAIAQRLDSSMLERVLVEETACPDSRSFEMSLNGYKPVEEVTPESIEEDRKRKRGEWKTHWMLAVNEIGIYEALFSSRKLEARKFRRWSATVMQKLRSKVGLEGYEVMRMTEKEIQNSIDDIIDTLYWDPEKKCVMQSVTVQGGDVEQVVFSRL